MPITQLRDLGAIQPNVSHPVVDKDEIVSGAIHFREARHDSDCSDSYAGCHVERSHPPPDHRAYHPERSRAKAKDPAALPSG